MNSGAPPIVITLALAHSLFVNDENPIVQIVDVDGAPMTIIGVVSGAAHLPERTADIYRVPPPGTVLASLPANVVRLRKGVGPAAADQQLHVLSARLAALLGSSPKDVWFQLSPMKRPQFQFGGFHFALIGAVVAVLLVACANLANLQLARGIGRSRELALRAALGARRRDIISQLVLESAILAGAGLVLGLVMTFGGMHLLEAGIPPRVASYVTAPQTSWRVFAFAVIASIVCVMIVGLFPALRVSRVDPNELLKSGAGTGANRKSRRQYGVMVVLEIGLSLVLLSGAAIVVRSALRINAVKVAYDLKPLTAAWMSWSSPRDTVVRFADVTGDIVSRVRALPDVGEAAASFTRFLPGHGVTVYGSNRAPRSVVGDGYKVVSPSYLRTLRLPILSGRDFLDGVPAEPEIVVDQKTAQVLWPAGNPVGEQIQLGSGGGVRPWLRVVGVVANVDDPSRSITSRSSSVRSSPIGAIYYLPSGRDSIVVQRLPRAPATMRRGFSYQVVVRSNVDHERMPITLRHYLRNGDPTRLLTADKMDAGLWLERASHDFVASLFSAFAGLAIALAALGIYGLVAHSVAERKREMGVRIALGASSRDVLHAMLREGNALALSGVALGLLFTKYSAGWLSAFSMEDDQYDAPLFATMAAVLFVVAVVAALIPALRATRIDPVESLRSE